MNVAPIIPTDPAIEVKKKAEHFHKVTKLSARYNWSLLSRIALRAVIRVLEFGAIKYAPHDWEKHGLSWTENLNSLHNHLAHIEDGNDYDFDENCEGCKTQSCATHSGLPHVDHLLCRALFMAHLYRMNKERDDRYAKNKPSKV